MNIKNFFKNLGIAFKGTSGTVQSLGSGIPAWNTETEYYSRWVFACVNLISNKLAETEWRLYKQVKGEVVEIVDHELLGLLYKFNKDMTKFDAIKLSIIYFLLQGKAPWVISRTESGKAQEIYVVPPTQLKITGKDENGRATKYKYGKNEIPATDVIYFKNPNPDNPLDGRSHISAIRDTVETDDKMTKWNKHLISTGAKPSVVIEVPAPLNAEEQKIMRGQFDEQYGGFENANKTMILSNGAKISPFSLPPKDLEWISGRNLNREEILSIFGVPKILLGLEGQYNRATAETSEMVFGKYTLDPIMTMITEQLNEFLVPKFGQDLWLDFESFAPEDSEMKLKWLQAGTNVWQTVNETRNELGKEPLAGGDAIYQSIMNVPSMTDVDTGKKSCNCGHDHGPEKVSEYKILRAKEGNRVPSKKQRQVIARISARNIDAKRYGKDIAEKFEQKMKEKDDKNKPVLTVKAGGTESRISLDEATKEKIWREYVSVKDVISNGWKQKMMQIFERQAKEIQEKLTEKKNFKKLTPADLLFEDDDEVSLTMKIIEPQYYASLMKGADMGVSLINQPKINLAEIPKVKEWTEKVAEKYAKEITATTKEAFTKIIANGIEAGQGPMKISDQIGEYLSGIAEYRADMIARTETARAMTAGEAYAWETYDIKDVEWYLAGTDSCDICVANSMADWSIKEAQDGISEHSHPNCECLFLPK